MIQLVRWAAGRIMKTALFAATFAASTVYASPIAHGRWRSRIIGFALFCVAAVTIIHALATADPI